jgi:hydroxyacylglutathione hydrolase
VRQEPFQRAVVHDRRPAAHELLDVTAHTRPLTTAEFLAHRADDATVVDARDPREFATGHVRGSLNVPADGRFAEQAGTVVEPDRRILLVAPAGREAELVLRLARVGLDNVTGYLYEPEASFLDIPAEVVPASRVTAGELRDALADRPAPALLDVHNSAEVTAGRIEGALHIPLAELPGRLGEVPDTAVVVYCAAGSRSRRACRARPGIPTSPT